ncbi:Glycerate dehydrogenase OS=Castellaniella defragrans OX=75697 GN=HNR28_002816 PE=3 SV=1 [Castellaniella defragrans]
MKVFMVGEAASHMDQLATHIPGNVGLVAWPREAAYADTFDREISPEDCIVSLRFTRTGASMPVFRLLHVPGAGLDGIDLARVPADCTVCNVFEHEIPIAEFVMLGMLEWEIRLCEMRSGFTAQAWSDIYRRRRPHGELYGKTLVLIGLGRIGRAVAQRARVFGMNVLAVDRASAHEGKVDGLHPPQEFFDVLPQADFVAVTCPLTDETRGLFDEHAFARMKRTAVFINVSRAPVADEHALYEALRDHRIAGAILDVWYRYPDNESQNVPPSDEPLLDLPNIIATPHSSAWSASLPGRRYEVIGQNIGRLIRGEPLVNVVKRG